MEDARITNAEKVEMLDRLAAAHAELAAIAVSLERDLWTKRFRPEVWSPAEIIEHVLLAERSLLDQICVHRNDPVNPDWRALTAGQEDRLRQVLPSLGRARSGPKLVAFNGLDQATVDQALRTSYMRFAEMVEGSTDRPMKSIVIEQSFFGTLNAYLWMLYVPLHTERHVQQLRKTLAEKT